MTKRSVILVGVLILMVAVGSTAIGVVSSRAAVEAANGTYYTFLPLVLKALQVGTSPTFYFAGNAAVGSGGGVQAVLGREASQIILHEPAFVFLSPPTDCAAKNFSASLLTDAATILNSGYVANFRLKYRAPGSSTWIVPSGNPPFCEILDPATTCVSSTQITIPARSEIVLETNVGNITGSLWLPFSWICEGT